MNIRDFLEKAIDYIFDIRVVDLPNHIAMFVISCGIGYAVALILIGFPVSLWEYFTGKKVNREKEEKVIKYTAILLTIVCILRLLYESTN